MIRHSQENNKRAEIRQDDDETAQEKQNFWIISYRV